MAAKDGKGGDREILDYPLWSIASNAAGWIVVGGGGGTSKTGIGNGLALYKFDVSRSSFIKSAVLNTDTRAINNLALHPTAPFIAACSGANVLLFSIESATNNDNEANGTRIVEVGSFVADYHEEKPDLRIATFAATGLLATGGADGVINTWELPFDGREQLPSLEAASGTAPIESRSYFKRLFRFNHMPNAIALNSDVSKLAATSNEECIVWSVKDGKRLWAKQFTAAQLLRYRGCSFVPGAEEQLFVAHHLPGRGGRGGYKGASHLSRVESGTGKALRTAKVLATHHTAFAASHDGKHIALATGDGDLAVYDAKSFSRVMLRTGVHELFITDVAFTPNDSHVLTTSGDYTFLRTRVEHDPSSPLRWVAVLLVLLALLLLLFRNQLGLW